MLAKAGNDGIRLDAFVFEKADKNKPIQCALHALGQLLAVQFISRTFEHARQRLTPLVQFIEEVIIEVARFTGK